MRRDLALRVVLCPKSTTPWSIARAFRWREMLESGEYATIREIAAAEKVSETYVGRMLRLTLLAPDIVEAGPGRAAAGRDHVGSADATVSGTLDYSAIGTSPSLNP